MSCGVLNKFALHFLPVFALHVNCYVYPLFSAEDFVNFCWFDHTHPSLYLLVQSNLFQVSYEKVSKLHFCVYSFSYSVISCRFKTTTLAILQKRFIIDICWDCRLVSLVLLSNLKF